jgi:environmental stress-induced protein Ves
LSIEIQRAVDRTPQPWKNGLGVQYEITCNGSLPDDWTWRLSTADITQDVPFSVFPGVNREFCVADGNGVVLNINGVDHRCVPGSITKFRGDDVVFATLIDGPMRALNLMVRDGGAEKHIDHSFSSSAVAVVCVGQTQRLQLDGVESELGVLDAVIVKEGNLSEANDWRHSVFIV